MADIFFSYKREDRAAVEPLVELIEQEGLSVWWDPTLVAGERFDQVIHREIEKASCVMVAWSADSIDAVWVRDEASAGRDRGILVPLSLDGVPPPLGFRQYQTPNLSGWSGDPDDPRIRQLIAGVRRLIEQGVSGQSEPATARDAARPRSPSPSAPAGTARTRVASGTPVAHARHGHPQRGLSRRRIVYGLAAGGLGLAAGGGVFLFGIAGRRSGRLPPARTAEFDLVTVDAKGYKKDAQRQTAEVFELPLDDNTALEFSLIPAGGFQIGSPESEAQRRPNEGPQQFIELRPFALGRTTVTQAQWAAVVNAAPETIEETLSRYPSSFRGDELPVETVSWRQAMEFCRRLSIVVGLTCRLPSEAEWEYACRARTTTPFHFGPTLSPELANYCSLGGAVCGTNDGEDISRIVYNGAEYPSGAYGEGPVAVSFRNGTVEARSFPPNRFGLFQMHGNVWEHCLDTGPTDYRHIRKDGSPYVGQDDSHVLRGGAWSHNPAICRSAYRDGMGASSPGWEGRVGLRVVCELPGAPA